jgi:hypothetical protein
MVHNQRQRQQRNAMVDLDEVVAGGVQPSQRDRARERRRASDEKPGDDSGQRDGPEGEVENQLWNGSRLAVARETVAKPGHEGLPVEREVKAEGGHHDQGRKPVQVQPGKAREAERGRAKGSLASMKVEEQNQSARQRHERSDKEDNINDEMDVRATHDR